MEVIRVIEVTRSLKIIRVMEVKRVMSKNFMFVFFNVLKVQEVIRVIR